MNNSVKNSPTLFEGNVTDQFWPHILQELSASYSADIFETWFVSLKATWRADQQTLVIHAPNDFSGIWIENHYLDVIKEKVAARVGEEVRVELQVSAFPDWDLEKPAPKREATDSDDSLSHDSRLEPRLRHPDVLSAAARPVLNLNPRNTFENFIIGPSNQLAHAASMAVAQNPGMSFNPLFLYGETGLGKTHLMQAIAHSVKQARPDANVVYISCEKFTNKFLKAIRENTLEKFRSQFRKVDVLLIDDVQFLANKERTQEEFFHTFNELHSADRQVCLSSDRPAGEIDQLENRLVSRFQWGMVTDIQAPDLETRVAILRKKAIALGYHLSHEILSYLAENITRNVRRMEGALIKVGTYSTLVDKQMDMETVERLVRDILQDEENTQVSVESIQKKVIEYYHLKSDAMTIKRRTSDIAFPRQIAMYLCRLLTNLPLKQIGEHFGGRDHATVLYACKTVENMMEQDKSVKKTVDLLCRQIGGRSL